MGGGHNAATMQEIRFLEDGLRQSHDMTRQLNASYQEAKELLRQNSELLSALRLLDLPEEVGVAMDRFEEMSRPRDYVQLPGEAGEADNGFEQERMKRFIHLMKVIERHQLSRCKGSTGRSRRVPAEELPYPADTSPTSVERIIALQDQESIWDRLKAYWIEITSPME
ncbi:unnamed protein product [Effrenium voratum]|uniref:Uncharacterized protein n=1 Tax=Effrenium voratum TaxID=2562239 RepID=A0AA36N248_9DINO|nr:unnamed protein product [Effrenium voratum]CAJ1389403.1 unnamed protein product [Effrenium voratum]CAJ1441131.1 unnamed protein product [Effrenium voratum]|mmetsp:Transcript_93888/g.223342  ORF Transcript_93888/g.223342 Transcript_93888/m.223342 type:complete len:168 (-) Transcript_93888:86-589(-)